MLNTTRVVLARIARARGEIDEADALTEAVLRAPEIRQRDLRMIGINERGFVLAVAGRRDDALSLHRDALRLATSSADVRFVATALEGVAGCLTDTDAARAAMLLGAAEAVRGAPVPGTGADHAYLDGTTARARAALGDRLYDEALEASRVLTVHEATDLALRDERTSSPTPT